MHAYEFQEGDLLSHGLLVLVISLIFPKNASSSRDE